MAKFIFQAGVFFNAPLYAATVSTSVSVYDATTSSLAQIWNDRDGLDSKANPFTLTSAGKIEFYANAGRYNIVATNGGQSAQWDDVIIIDPDAGGAGGGTVDTVQAGAGITVNAADPANPIVTSHAVVLGEATVWTGNYTLSSALHNIFRETSGDVTVTIPTQATTNLTRANNESYMHHIRHKGGGTVVFSYAGVTLNLPAGGAASMSTAGQTITVAKSTTAADTWMIYGQCDSA